MSKSRVAIVDIQCVIKDKQWFIKEFSIKEIVPHPRKTRSLMFSHDDANFTKENKFSLSYIGTDYSTGDLQYNPEILYNYINPFDILLVKGRNKMQALKNCLIYYYTYNSELSQRWVDVWFKPLDQSCINVYNIDDEIAYSTTQSFIYNFNKPTFSLTHQNYNDQSLQRKCQYNHDGACTFRNVWKIYREWWQKN